MRTTSEPVRVEVSLVTAPDGAPGICLQLPDGYLILKKPEDAEDLAEVLVEAARNLRDPRRQLRLGRRVYKP